MISDSGIYVAFDTSGPVGSVVVARGAEPLSEAAIEGRGRHSSLLLPSIAEVLARADLERGDLDGVVVGEGPGSFTGVRVAAATAKGLAGGLEVPVWGRVELGGDRGDRR